MNDAAALHPVDAEPRFVVLYHQMPPDQPRGSHWDLMFQQGGALRTWAAAELPQWSGPATTGRLLPPHRLAYLDYEGPVSGNRGQVRRVDEGRCQWLSDTPQQVVIQLYGQRLRGTLYLQRLSVDAAVADDRDAVWRIWLSDRDERERVSEAS